ncbi:hypothetical protein ACLESD_13325 [Pyxidicoccus sp. 3LFB2]
MKRALWLCLSLSILVVGTAQATDFGTPPPQETAASLQTPAQDVCDAEKAVAASDSSAMPACGPCSGCVVKYNRCIATCPADPDPASCRVNCESDLDTCLTCCY